MEYQVRKATLVDMAAIHDLVTQLAVYERAANEVSTTASDYERDFSAGKFDAIVAVETTTGQIDGMALYYIAFSTWKGPYLWLEDFVVKEELRGKGIGQLLFEAVIDIAKQHNAFMKWQVLDWNEPAMRFYDKYQASYDKEWITCKLKL